MKLYEQAIELVRQENKASISLLQRRLKLSYGVAEKLINQMEKELIIGPYNGAKPRYVLGQNFKPYPLGGIIE